MNQDITLRPLCPDDGPAITALGEQTPETGAISFHSCFEFDPYASLVALDPTMQGVAVEVPGHEGFVGLGLMSVGECQFEGAVRPYAYLYSLSVHPDYRRRGIGSAIARWRVEAARAALGEDVVIFAGVQPGNEGSLMAARAWASQRLDGRGGAGVVKMRSRPPRPAPGLSVRPAEAADLEEIADKQNAFYRDFNFYPPQTAASLAAWHSQAPFGFPLHTYYLAEDPQGNILAGLSITEEGKVMTSHIVRMAWPMRLANLALRMLPSDGVLRRLLVRQMWFAPERLDAGAFLWQSLRWLWRDRGTMMMIFFDPLGPLVPALALPRLMPSAGGSLVLAGPVPLDPQRHIYHPV